MGHFRTTVSDKEHFNDETWEEIVAYSMTSNACVDRVCGGVTVSIKW
jgi:hypothetical protein